MKESGISFARILGKSQLLIFQNLILYIHNYTLRYWPGGVPCVLYHWHVLQVIYHI